MAGTEIGKGYLHIVPVAEGIQSSVSKMFKGVGEQVGATEGSSMASRMITAIKAAGIGAAIKKAVSEGANIEQSWGGIETMFGKKNSKTMAKYAKSAFKNAGVSANEYMEQVTSFSASLIGSLKGNTKKATKYANTAMVDMSDNANKFGTDIGAIQNAYQGFAKGNFTMLDNLKLGYGGTAGEMARLINETGVMGKKFKATSKNVSEVPFYKMIAAIHKTQKQMKVTGTTSKEASDTISGSFGMMKSSFSDFLATLTMNGSDAMKKFGMSNKAALNNLIASIGTYATNFGAAVWRLLENVSIIITKYAPKMIAQGTKLLANVSQGFVAGIPDFISKGLTMLDGFADNLAKNLPKIIENGRTIISNIIQGITNALPELIERAPDIITKFANVINDNAPTILKYGFELIVQLAKGVIASIPVLIQNVPKIFSAMYAAWKAVNWINLGKTAINLVKNGINALKTALPNALRNIGKSAINFFKNVNWAAAGRNVIKLLKTAIIAAKDLVVNALKTAGTNAVTAFKNISWSDVGKFIIQGIVTGIKNFGSLLYEGMKTLASNALAAAKKALKIGSPSKVFEHEIGKQIVAGTVKGVLKSKKKLTKAVKNTMTAGTKVAQKVIKSFSRKQKKSKSYASALYSSALATYQSKKANKKINTVQSVDYWNKISKSMKKGTKSYKSATKQLGTAKNSLTKSVSSLTKSYVKDVASIQKTLSKNIASVTKEYAEKIAELQDSYKQVVESRKSSLMSETSIFSLQSINLKQGAKTLINNLKSQVDSLTNYNTVMESLKTKLGVSSSLFNELQGTSIADFKTLQSINNMSTEQLKEYVDLWNQKNALAQSRAESDESDTLVDVNKQIKALEKARDKAIKALQTQAKKDLAKLQKTYLADLKAIGVNSKAKSKTVGSQIVSGIKQGVKDGSKSLNSTLAKLAKDAVTAAKKKLKIKSPSRVFADEIGSYIPSGVALGVQKNASSLNDAIAQMSDDAVSSGQKKFRTLSFAGANGANVPVNNQADFGGVIDLLEQLKALVEQGQNVYLDSDRLVGATAGKMDKELGRIRRWKR